MNKEIILASTNKGKVKEIRQILSPLGISVKALDELPEIPEIEETGATYEENAFIKAREVHKAIGKLTIGDDSGLEVDALSGEPGIRSARYAGGNSFSKKCIEKLLHELRDVPAHKRQGRFICVVALVGEVEPDRFVEEVFVGTCEGLITLEEKGDRGFGYDPIFYLPHLAKTVAELDDVTKNEISHRARAFKKLKTYFENMA